MFIFDTCEILNGVCQIPCKTTAGNSSLYLKTYKKSDKYLLDSDNNIIDVVSGPIDFYSFAQFDGDINFVQNALVGDGGASGVGFEYMLTFSLYGINTKTLNDIRMLLRAPMSAVLETKSGEMIYLGYSTAGSVSESAGGTGQAITDTSGFTVTIKWTDGHGPLVIDSAALGLSKINLIDDCDTPIS
jgi:hypothetical protein